MQYYVSKTYETMYAGQYARNMFIVLSDSERLHLKDKIDQLIEDIEAKIESGRMVRHMTKSGTLAKKGKGSNPLLDYWNQKDEEALVFLKRMTWFTEYTESQAIDPTVYQIETIVEKMLVKVYGYHYGKFINWLKLWHDNKEVTSNDMRNHMERKRSLAKQLKDEGLLAKDFVVGY